MAQTEVFSHFLEGTKALNAEKKGKGRRGKQAGAVSRSLLSST